MIETVWNNKYLFKIILNKHCAIFELQFPFIFQLDTKIDGDKDEYSRSIEVCY